MVWRGVAWCDAVSPVAAIALDPVTDKWRLVPFGEYKAHHPRSSATVGVLEVFAQTATMDTVTPEGEFLHKEIMYSPKLLAHADASHRHAALESALGCSLSEVRTLVELGSSADHGLTKFERAAILLWCSIVLPFIFVPDWPSVG